MAVIKTELRVRCYFHFRNPTQAQIDQFHALLREQAKVWVHLQKDKLYGQVECIYQRIKSRIAQWKLCSEQMVYKVKANWERCLASRKSKLSVFTTCLYGKRTHQRACLEKRLREVSILFNFTFTKIKCF